MIKKLLNPISQFTIMLSEDDRTRFQYWSKIEQYWHAGLLPNAVFGSTFPTVQHSQDNPVDIQSFCTVGLGGLYRAANGLGEYWSSMVVSRDKAATRHELAFWLDWTKTSLDIVNTILSSQTPNALQSVVQTYAIVQDYMIDRPSPTGNATRNHAHPVRRPAPVVVGQLRNHLCSLNSHLMDPSTGSVTRDLQHCYTEVNSLISRYTDFFKTFLRRDVRDSFNSTVSEEYMYSMAVMPQASLFRSSNGLPPIPGYA